MPMDMTLMDSNRNVLHTITETKLQNEYNYFFDSEFKGTGTIMNVRFVRVQLNRKKLSPFPRARGVWHRD